MNRPCRAADSGWNSPPRDRWEQQLQDFLHARFGYCLTGLTIEDSLFFLRGLGANGKSVLLRTTAGLFADYHKTASIDMFTVSTAAIGIQLI